MDKRKYLLIVYILLIAVSIFGIFKTNVNYDMSKYLPDDSSVKKGMELMEDEYGEMSSITVMFEGLDEDEQLARQKDIENIKNVKSVVFIPDDEQYQKDGYTKFTVNVAANTYSSEARNVLKAIKNKYSDTMYLSGAVVDNDMMTQTLVDELPLIALIAVVVIFAILFLLCNSWVEPFLYMTSIGVAILINMGTNALLPSVSFMTFTVAALLQMGLSMDYSIMLMNRYGQEKKNYGNAEQAMKAALANSFAPVSGSSVTTIFGLLALVFMSFKIGKDMGIVLAKGVFISLICIFTVLPMLVVRFDKLMEKSRKKSLNFKMRSIMNGVKKLRFVILPLIVVVIAGAFFIKGDMNISFIKTYDNADQTKIEEVFGVDNQTVILYKNDEDKENVARLTEQLENRSDVNYVEDYSNTIGKAYTYSELAKDMDMDEGQAKLLFQMYRDKQNDNKDEKVTMYDLVCYLDEHIAGDPTFAGFMTKEQLSQIAEAKKEMDAAKAQLDKSAEELSAAEQQLEYAQKQAGESKELAAQKEKLSAAKAQLESGMALYDTPMTDKELAESTDRDISDIDQMMQIYRISQLDVSNDTMQLDTFLDFIISDILPNEDYSAEIDDDMKAQVYDGKAQLDENRDLLIGDNYNRMIVSTNYPAEGESTFKGIGEIKSAAEKEFGECYLVGDSAMGYEMDNGFQKELNFVTILTVIAVFIVVIFTFRSLFSSAVLVAVIQGAVIITTAIVALQGYAVNYIALILVQCILMGATIDYGILLICNYVEDRKTLERSEALTVAMDRSIRTILTSSMILIGSCLSITFIMTQKVIAQTCTIIACGAAVSVVMVIFVLPAIIYMADRLIVGRKK